MRHTVLALGATIILPTFVLGIHWLPDIWPQWPSPSWALISRGA